MTRESYRTLPDANKRLEQLRRMKERGQVKGYRISAPWEEGKYVIDVDLGITEPLDETNGARYFTTILRDGKLVRVPYVHTPKDKRLLKELDEIQGSK